MDVTAGDVLLYRGHGFLSRAIRFLDGGEVNHAAIALSATDQAEAAAHGLDVSLIARAAEGAQAVIVMRAEDADTGAAVARARAYLDDGVPYAYQQILLLAGLCLTRRVPIDNALFRRALRRILEAAAELLNALVDRGTDLMICSEYVYRCYREAGLDLVPGVPGAAAVPGAAVPEAAAAPGAAPEAAALPGGAVPEATTAPGAVPEAAAVPAGPGDGVVLMEWLETRPLPESAPVAGATADPAAVAERAEYEVDELLARYFVAEEGSAVAPAGAVLEVEAVLPEVTDEEIAAAAAALGAAAARARQPGGAVMESAIDPVGALRSLFSTNANFVTPRDLHVSALLHEVDRVP
ncbi:C40 family peptidase [Georgenia subflava]|uniref:Uncharacterized protein n=1 Tax=Georgenia subflava TaxID=1622177 RepID=A0A6N7EED3_9MICO|nr:hypothetical protein [Georgenia subflava]MPV36380.1 hypothetical protein [Georgenia subflava]